VHIFTAMKKNLVYLSILAVVVMFGSCRKIQEDQLLKGLWVVEGLYFDTISVNQLKTFFPGHDATNKCCQYKINFDEDDLVIGYYLTNDSFTYVTTGTWKLVEFNKLQLKLDNFANGEFAIKNKSTKRRWLSSEKNIVPAKTMPPMPSYDTIYTRIELIKQ